MDERDSKKMIQLAREGKSISKIVDEDFPQCTYWDVYMAVYAGGEKSAVGVKRKISNRLKKIPSLPIEEQADMLEEIDELVWHLYDRYKESQQKLDDIRGVIER